MTKFESTVRVIYFAQEDVYSTLSDTEKMGSFGEMLPASSGASVSFGCDTMTVSAGMMGSVTLRIVEREEPKCIKFVSEQSPVPFSFWIQLLPMTPASCKMRLTVQAELNPFIKSMVQKPLQEAVEKIADVLQAADYSR